jgi:hypothetical protein
MALSTWIDTPPGMLSAAYLCVRIASFMYSHSMYSSFNVVKERADTWSSFTAIAVQEKQDELIPLYFVQQYGGADFSSSII